MSRANFTPLQFACLIVSPLLAQLPTPQIRLITNAATLADPGYYCCEPPISPGTIITIFGTSLSDGTTKAASGYPLPTQLAGARVMFNGIAAPLFYASPGQINAEVPTELVAPSLVNIGVDVQFSAGLASGLRVGRSLSTLSPGIFTLDQNGTGPGAILRAADYSLICPPRRNECTGNPAIRGEAIAIYLTGLGPVAGPWISGNAAGGAYQTEQTASVRFDDVSAVVLYSGLAPNFAGLYQVNVLVPGNAPLGDAVSLTLSMGDPAITLGASNRVTIPISDKLTPPSSVVGGPPGGNVLAIATDPHSSGVLFVGTNGRSLFKSSDGGSRG